ncbi:MAG: hypothetical protein HYS13_03380 [Planctomycetia bacterium]|nr:hypothetical protein [Planctomycetia bacterium]
MRFTVVWDDEALNQLAVIWLDADDRAAVTSAQAAIDAELAMAPASKGTSVSEGLRRLVKSPLQVLFEVADADRLVRVTAVRAE